MSRAKTLKPENRRLFSKEMDKVLIEYYPAYGSRKTQKIIKILCGQEIEIDQIVSRANYLGIKLISKRIERNKPESVDPLLLSSITPAAWICQPWGKRIKANLASAERRLYGR